MKRFRTFLGEKAEREAFFSILLAALVLVHIGTFASWQGATAHLALISLLLLLVFVLFFHSRLFNAMKLTVVLLVGLLYRADVAGRDTVNDVYWSTTQGLEYLLEGRNPYAHNMTRVMEVNPGFQRYDAYPYLSGVMLFELPAYLLCGNVRYALVFFDLGVGVLLYLLLRSKGEDLAKSCATLYVLWDVLFAYPVLSYTLCDGFVDPIMNFFLLLCIYLGVRGRLRWAAVSLGLAMSSKQYSILFAIPMLVFFWKQRRPRPIAMACVVTTVIVLPFFIWSPRHFVRDTVFLYLEFARGDIVIPTDPAPAAPGGLVPNLAAKGPPLWNTALFPMLAARGIAVPKTVVSILHWVVVLGLMGWGCVRLKSVEDVCVVYTVCFVFFLLLSPYAQFHYYFSILPFLLLFLAGFRRARADGSSTE